MTFEEIIFLHKRQQTDSCIPESKGKVDIFLSPLRSSKHESRALRSKILLQLLVIFLRICQQVATKLGNTISSIGSKQQVNSSEISRKETEKQKSNLMSRSYELKNLERGSTGRMLLSPKAMSMTGCQTV